MFIVGDGYSGSTLLDMLLGSHSRMVGLGEVDDFDAFVEQNAFCTCRRPQRDCPFWCRVLDQVEGRSFRLVGPESTLDDTIASSAALLRAARHVAGAALVVDSSKRPGRARLLCESEMIDGLVVHLIRDGRGVGWAHAKRGESFPLAVEHWARRNAEVEAWLASDGSPPHIRVEYEHLATRAHEVLVGLCDFLGVAFQPTMLRFRDTEHHQVGGNLMRFGSDDSIRLDDEWRTALRAEDLARFEQIMSTRPRPGRETAAIPSHGKEGT